MKWFANTPYVYVTNHKKSHFCNENQFQSLNKGRHCVHHRWYALTDTWEFLNPGCKYLSEASYNCPSSSGSQIPLKYIWKCKELAYSAWCWIQIVKWTLGSCFWCLKTPQNVKNRKINIQYPYIGQNSELFGEVRFSFISFNSTFF